MRDLPPRPEVLEMLTMIVEARNEREWRDQAACKGMNPTVFFPERNNPNAVKQAKTVCARCPVSTQCGEAGQTEQIARIKRAPFGGRHAGLDLQRDARRGRQGAGCLHARISD